jgi:hypothetical protein
MAENLNFVTGHSTMLHLRARGFAPLTTRDPKPLI